MYKTSHLELLTASSHFSALVHVLFFSALFLPERMCERAACLCVSPRSCKFSGCMHVCTVRQPAFEYYSPMFTVIIRKWPCWTRAQSSTSLCKRRFHPENRKYKNNAVSTSKNCATFLQPGAHNISVIAQKQWQNRTQVAAFFPPNINVTASVIYLIFI